MIGLAVLIRQHGEALDYDLMTRLGGRVSQVGKTIPWDALSVFVRWLPPDAALYRSMHPKEWQFRQQQPYLMADLYDLVSILRAEYEAAHTKGGKVTPPPPYPRPGVEDPNRKKIGSDPIPVSKFEEWWDAGSKEA